MMKSHPCRILLVDDHQILRECVRSLLQGFPEFSVVGEAFDGHSALAATHELKPDLIILDMAMPGLNGLECLRRLAHLKHPPKVLVLSMYDEAARVREAFAFGARGYLLKGCTLDDLAQAIRVIHSGQVFLTPWTTGILHKAMTRTDSPPSPTTILTPREREILQLLAEGHNVKDIAQRLSISLKTVDTHRLNLMRKLEVHSLAVLTRRAVELCVTSI
jgi:DNA-binding NarL/FixJ family response regulator